ncbi:MAG: hypothetical protein JW820_14985 [Spirochaetales bacterium]|nr:hypothetical protein [Spirochaetales bacterium]
MPTRTAAVLAALLTCLTVALHAQSPLPPDARGILADRDRIRALHPRIEGSASELQLLELVEARLADLRVPYSRFGFRESDLTHSFSTCLEANLPGLLPDTLVLVAPLNHPPEASPEQDGSINTALALAILERYSREPPPLSLKVLFLGAEYGGDPILDSPEAEAAESDAGEEDDYPKGSRLFLRDFYPEHRAMVLYLNLERIPSRLQLRAGGRGIESPYWLIDRLTTSLNATDIFFLVRGNENQIFRVGLTSERTIIEPYLDAGYPAASLEGEYAALSPLEQENWVFAFNLFFASFLEGFRDGIPETWDHHYLFFQARGFYLSISEKTYVIILIAVLAGILLYGLIFTRRLRKYLRVLLRSFWALPTMLAFIFVLLFLASWAIEAVLALRNMPSLWEELPLLFLAFKITLPLLVLFILLNFLHRLPIPRRGSFYSAAALLFLLVDIIVLAIINISFTYYFLWAFAFALLFSAASNRVLKVLLFLAAPYWIVKTVFELFTLPRLEFCQVLLLSKVSGNLLIAVVLLPFVLMFIRLRLIFPPLHIVTDRARRNATAALFVVVTGGLLSVFFLYSPYAGGRPQPVTAHYRIDADSGENRLDLSSPAPLGSVRVRNAQESTVVSTQARRIEIPLPATEELLETRTSSVGFLDRKNVSLTLLPAGRPYRVYLRISSADEFTLFDANFPYLRGPAGTQYEILIGANPPVPLPVELTVPRDRDFRVEIRMDYLTPPTAYAVSGENIDVRSRLTYRRVLAVRT